MNRPRALSVFKSIVAWVFMILLGLFFVLQGVAKLLPGSPWPEMFANWGFPGGFFAAIGVVELVAGIAMVVPRTRLVAAATLSVVMFGAAATHVVHVELPNIAVTLVLAVWLGAITYRRWAKRATSSKDLAPQIRGVTSG